MQISSGPGQTIALGDRGLVQMSSLPASLVMEALLHHHLPEIEVEAGG